MKKIIIAVLALLSLNIASAQFQVADTAPTTYVVYGMKAGVSLKYTKRGEVSEYFLQLNTTNQFDGAMLIYLGNRDKARASLSQLLNELFELDKAYTLNDNMSPFGLIIPIAKYPIGIVFALVRMCIHSRLLGSYLCRAFDIPLSASGGL